MDGPRNFHYLNQSNCYEVDVIDDAKEYVATRRAMNVVGIGSNEQVVWIYGAPLSALINFLLMLDRFTELFLT